MGEPLLLITVVTLVILAIRRGKPVVLEDSLVTERPGQYHITFAPHSIWPNLLSIAVKMLHEAG